MQVATSSHWIEPNIEGCGTIVSAETSVAAAIALLQSQPEGCLWVSRGDGTIPESSPHAAQIKGYVTASQLLAVIATPTQGNPLERNLGEIAQSSPALPIQATATAPEFKTAIQALAESNALRFLVVNDQQQVLGQLSREALQQGIIDQLMTPGSPPQGSAPMTEQIQTISTQPSTSNQTQNPAIQLPQNPAATQLSPTVQPTLQTALDQLSQALKDLEVHGQAESRLQHRIAFEALLTQISTQFLNLQEGEIDQALHEALARTATFTDCDRACIFLYSHDGSEAHCHHEWNRDNLIPFTKPLRSILRHSFPWSLEQMQQQQPIHVPDVEALPFEAEPEREAAQKLQAQSYVVLPIHFQEQPLGWLAFYTVHQLKTWAPADLKQLETLSSIIAGVIARQQAEAALIESEARFAQLAENLDQIFFIYQADPYQLIYISPAYEQIWGLSCQSLYEEPDHWYSTVHPEDHERVRAEMKRRRSEGISVDLEYRILHPNGEERWIRSRSFPLRDSTGRIYRLAGIAEDVSDRHRYEAALARSEAKFSQAFRLNPIPMCITVLGESHFLEVNDAFCDHSGFSREELIGKTAWELDMIVDPAQYVAIHETLLSQGSFQNMELHSRDRLGRLRIAQSSGIRMDVEGQERILVISRDITDQRQQETQRQQIEQALRQASQAAKAASKAKSELLAMVSHEIRTPLNAILSMSNLLLEEGLTSPQREQMKVLKQGGHELLSMVDEVLDFSRQEAIEDSQISLEVSSFELDGCLSEVLELFFPQAQAKGLTLRAERSPLVGQTMVSDRQRLKQILSNLLSNAIKFTQSGQITIQVNPSPMEKTDVLFSVRDQGIGIDQVALDKLFQPFSQANSSISKQYGGTGLGLNICDRIIRRLGGNIWVESGGNIGGHPPESWAMLQSKPSPNSTAPHPGSHFYFNLPPGRLPEGTKPRLAIVRETSPSQNSPNPASSATATNSSATASSVPIPQLPPASSKILLVEDIELNQRVAQLLLQSMGYSADVASSGETAIAALEQQTYDLLFLDLNLPELNGYEIFQRVQALPHKPWVIVMSAAVDQASRDRCNSLGMTNFVPKPISREALTLALSRFWQQRQNQSVSRNGFPSLSSQAPSLKLGLFNEVRQLCGNDQSFKDLLLTYRNDAALQLQALANAQVEKNGLALFEVLHSLGPATSSLGGASLAELCAHLEGQLRNHGFYPLEPGQQGEATNVDWTAIAAQVNAIEAEYHRLIAAMEFQTWELEQS